MGASISIEARNAKALSEAIDKQTEKDNKVYKGLKEVNDLLLGGLSQADFVEYRPIIYKNIIDSAQEVINYMHKVELKPSNDANQALAQKILDYSAESIDTVLFSPEIVKALDELRKDPIILKVMNEYQVSLMDNAPYFFREVTRIGAPGYIPNETDILWARQKGTGITETQFGTSVFPIRVIDVNYQPLELNKWIQYFQDVTSVIFCAALSEYDQASLEGEYGKKQNRINESIILFDSIINSQCLPQASVILLLNKFDIFKRKLPKVPLENYFPEYTGGNNVNSAAKHLLWKFMQTNKSKLQVYPHFTNAINDPSVIQLACAAVKETMLQNSMRDTVILD
ncbi:hypothetical protein AX16_005266 [Volvariella volvacea WC 439]|nr:hypothetical protein AX16_005266 [Volvariella volvacea WC 439]